MSVSPARYVVVVGATISGTGGGAVETASTTAWLFVLPAPLLINARNCVWSSAAATPGIVNAALVAPAMSAKFGAAEFFRCH